MPLDRALGVLWDIEKDCFTFKLNVKDKPSTRRGMLSVLSSFYDPLGLIAPYLLKGKIILQSLCALKLGWDDQVSAEIKLEWEKWLQTLPTVESLSIPRCIKPVEFGKVHESSLHHFSDASDFGYGQVSYIRLVDTKGEVCCRLMMSKSRVAPIKFTSMPRLELTAARISARVSVMLKRDLEIAINKQVFWTDSQVVLGYLRNERKKLKIFVANRVQGIKDVSDVKDWRYIPSELNPGDISSRGGDAGNEKQRKFWYEGPEFLWRDEATWESFTCNIKEPDDDDPEVKRIQVHATKVKVSENFLERLVMKLSSWNRLRRVLAWILLFKRKLLMKINGKSFSNNNLSVEDIKVAEMFILRQVQGDSFHEDKKNLLISKPLKQSSSIYSLDPYVDENEIIRVGGRVENSVLEPEIQHPIILPKNAKVSQLIIEYCHKKVAHGGRSASINEVRNQGYWIVGVNSMTRKILYYCVMCRYLRGKVGEQKMANLPKERLVESPPFTYCGVDCFGPFIITQRRKELKRYGVLFTCLSCRGVHIEVASSLETDTFILALRRLIARRGNVRFMRSDNGTNFVGANRELRKAISEMDNEKINVFMNEHGGEWVWKFNPPAASHFGGVWERQIRSARDILSALLKTHSSSLDDESLTTLMTEVEAIINSRPLTTETLSDGTSPKPICPSNLLTMKSSVVMPPPGEFTRCDLYSRRRWRRVQHIANEFWSRWRKEFLATLQIRKCWAKKRRNFSVGDIVLLKEDQYKIRNQWPLAKVIEARKDKHGLVRAVDIKLAHNGNILHRPIAKIILISESEEH